MHSWYSERSECRHVSLHFRPTLPTQGALTVARLCPLPSLSPGNKVKLLLASPVLSPGWVGLLSAKGEAGCFPSPSCGTTCDHATKTKEVEGKEGRGGEGAPLRERGEDTGVVPREAVCAFGALLRRGGSFSKWTGCMTRWNRCFEKYSKRVKERGSCTIL